MQPLLELATRRVLVVDDDAAVMELVTTRLLLAGFRVFTARDGHDAMRRMSEVKVDAMVLDLNMPSMDGFKVLDRLRSMGRLPPTLVLTARHEVADVQRAIELGARDFLAKPFKDQQLLMRVARLFRSPAAPQASAPTAAKAATTQEI